MPKQGDIYVIEQFAGVNVEKQPFAIDDSECQVGTNVVVKDGAVEVRGGLELFAEDTNLTGGIPMMRRYYKRDGTKQLVFANDDDYYYITAANQTFQRIGDYGTAVDNPTAFQYKNVLLFGTGSTANTPYKYDATTATITAATIAFNDLNPDTITDSGSGFGSFRAGDKIVVSGSTSNDGEYTIATAAAGTLTLIAGDSLTTEAAGASVTITSSGISEISTPASSNGDLRFYTQYNGQNIRFCVGAGIQSDDATDNVTTLYYTPDPDDWSATGAGNLQIGDTDGQDITGLIQMNDLVVYKEYSKHYLSSFYEENSGTFALRNNGSDTSSGASNHESIIPVDGDTATLTDKFKSIEGYGREGTAQGNARPKQYATNINPIISSLTWSGDNMVRARGIQYDRLMLHGVPFNGAQYNNLVLVGHLDEPTINGQPSWTTWGMRAGAFEIFRDSNNEDQLYVSDPLQAKIYKYDPNIYSDNGFGYTRIWKSKKFQLNQRADYDTLKHVIIEGSMRTITEITVTIIVDGREQQYVIDSTQLVESGLVSGSYIGDRVIGDEIVGGNSAETDKFRYLAVMEVPNSLRYAKNVEIELRNDGAGQFWSMDHLSINLPINIKNIPDNHKVTRTV